MGAVKLKVQEITRFIIVWIFYFYATFVWFNTKIISEGDKRFRFPLKSQFVLAIVQAQCGILGLVTWIENPQTFCQSRSLYYLFLIIFTVSVESLSFYFYSFSRIVQ